MELLVIVLAVAFLILTGFVWTTYDKVERVELFLTSHDFVVHPREEDEDYEED